MAVIETDIILTLISSRDKRHREAVEIIRSIKTLKMSPYALIKLDLLILFNRLEVKLSEFYEAFSKMLSYYDIEIIKPNPKHLTKGWELREKYGLTYFDSLHASVALIENETLISYDKRYLGLRELKYLTPQEALRLLTKS
ncbi:MAG: type II toxin-antitoxin system VapC family toxin [Sulfolobales archaeon]